MNKYTKSQSATHNGTLNGIKEKKKARVARHDGRVANNEGRTARERLASLDERGLVAKKERARLMKAIK